MSIRDLYQKPKKETGKNAPRFARYPDHFIHQTDLLFLPKDQGYRYCLVIVDIGTRLLDGEPLKTKETKEVLSAIQAIYKRGPLKLPNGRIEVDDGSEFKGSVAAWFKKMKVPIRTAKPQRHRQQAIVEAANRQIGTQIHKRQTYQELKTGKVSRHWINYLPKVITKLNARRTKQHEKRKLKPITPMKADVIKKDKDGNDIEMYPCEGDSCNALEQGTKVRVALNYPKDNVTGKRLHGKFRDSDIRWTTKVYTITHTILKPNQPPMYAVNDQYDATYTKGQLQVVDETKKTVNKKKGKKASLVDSDSEFGSSDIEPDVNSDGEEIFEADAIIGKKTIKKIVHYQVKWSDGDTTFEPRAKVKKDLPEILKEYENSLKKK